MKDIVIIGANGNARDVLWLLEDNNQFDKGWNILGFIDSDSVGEEPVEGYYIIGDDEWLMNYSHPISVVCALGSPALRRKVTDRYKRERDRISFPALVSKNANVSPYAKLGEGCVIFPRAVVTTNVVLGNFVYVHFCSTIGHDSVLRDFVSVNPGANISGNVVIERDCEIGTGSCVIQGVRIGEKTVVGAGSVIIRDTPGRCTVVGNPGRILEK